MQSLLLDDQHCTRLEGERWRHHRLRLDVHQISALLAPDGRRRGAPTLKCTLVTFSDSLPTVEYLFYYENTCLSRPQTWGTYYYLWRLVVGRGRRQGEASMRPPRTRRLFPDTCGTRPLSTDAGYRKIIAWKCTGGNVVLFVFWEFTMLHYHILNWVEWG